MITVIQGHIYSDKKMIGYHNGASIVPEDIQIHFFDDMPLSLAELFELTDKLRIFHGV